MEDPKMLRIKASLKQMSRLRNGHRVRIQKEDMEGQGINLIVHPETYNPAVKAFSRDKGIMIQLTPDEILLNKAQGSSGSGIFGKMFDRAGKKTMVKPATKALYSVAVANGSGMFGKKFDRAVKKTIGKPATKALYSVADKVGKPIVKKAIADLQKYAPEIGATALSSLAVASGNPELAPLGAELGAKLGKKIGKAGADYANKKLDGNGLTPVGVGLYTGTRMMGRGSHKEVSSVGCGGNLLRGQSHLPPALMSQPYSANFQFQHTLPPAYVRHIKGNGLTPV